MSRLSLVLCSLFAASLLVSGQTPQRGNGLPSATFRPYKSVHVLTIGINRYRATGYPVVIGEDRIFPPKAGAIGDRQRVEGSFEDLLERAGIEDFRFHDLRHTFASWYMMNGGDLYELAKILGHSNIKMTERYAKLARRHIAKTGSTAREIWKLLEQENFEQKNAG